MTPGQFLFASRMPLTNDGKVGHVALRAAPDSEPATGPGISPKELFSHPSVSAMADNLDPLSGNGAPGEEVFVFPTTVAQRRFWLLDHLNPGNPALNVPLAARLKGQVDRAILGKAVNEILQRHEILRTGFRTIEDELVQVVPPERLITLDWHDISELPESDREARVNQLMLEEGVRPFNLSIGPIFRGGVVKVREDEHVLMLTMHHIGCDGWSNGIVMREVAEIYSRLLTGGEPLPELPLQYADFAEWQRNWLESPAAEEHHQFWKLRLQGNLPVLNLPADRPRKLVRSHASAIQTLLLPQALREALMDLCAREDVTPFMLFFAAYAILLYRYANEPDVIIGCPAANRSQTELEGLVGLFSNPLVMRVNLSGNPTFRTVLARVKDLSLEAFDHQAYPFEKLLEEVQTDTQRVGSQWMRVYFIFQRAFMQPQQMPNLTLTPLRSVSPGAMFEWTLGVLERAEGIRLQLEYNTDLFDQASIERMLQQFKHLLEAALVDLTKPIDELPVLSPAERQQVITEWNQTQSDIPRQLRVHELFEQQVLLTPHVPAVRDDRRSLSYQELNTRANKLGHHLRDLGVDPGSHVGLAVDEGSVEFTIGFLGILKAGGSCVALNRRDCSGNLSHLIRRCRLTILLADSSLSSAPLPAGLITVIFDADTAATDNQPGENLNTRVAAEQPACVRFSSGRSGEPKGAVISHQALLNSACAARRELGLQFHDSVGGSLDEMFPALLAGAVLVAPARDFSPESWLRWVTSQHITVAALPTPFWHDVAYALTHNRGLSGGNLRLLVVGGSRISSKALSEWRRVTADRVRLLGRYFLAETGGAAAFSEGVGVADEFSTGLSVFKPAANLRLYILDANLQPVPMGVPGDLYVGGESLTSGYLDGSESRLISFIADPFAGKPGAKILKTGDCGRFVARGGIELVGRIEDLEKTDRLRLELCEISTILSRHPAVWEVLLAPWQEGGRKTLVAYIVSKSNPLPLPAEIRAFAEERLPGYMTPKAFLILKKFPLTPNGRVDMAKLPSPDSNAAGFEKKVTAPRTITEIKLCNIWCDVLALKQVGVRENFFDLGGDSLRAIRLASRIKRELKIDLPAQALFQHPTVLELAKVLSTQAKIGRSPELMPLHALDSGPTMVFLIGPGSLELFNLANFLRGDMTLYASMAPLPEAVVKAAADRRVSSLARMEDLAAPHAAMIERLETTGHLLLTGYCYGGVLAFEVAQQLRRAGKQVAGVLLLDAWMERPSVWWRKMTWFRGHVRNTWRTGTSYLWQKFKNRVKFEKNNITSERELTMSGDFGGEVPWVVTERIYKHAMFGYRAQPLSCRGFVLAPKDDWMIHSYQHIDSSLGAGRLFNRGVEVSQVPGNHLNVLNWQNLSELAQIYRDVADKFRSDIPSPEYQKTTRQDGKETNMAIVR